MLEKLLEVFLVGHNSFRQELELPPVVPAPRNAAIYQIPIESKVWWSCRKNIKPGCSG